MNLETENTISHNDECIIIWLFAILYVSYTNKLTALKIQKSIPINDGTVIHANVVEILTNIWRHMNIQCTLNDIQSVLFNVSGTSMLMSTLGKEYLSIFGQQPNNFAKLTLLKRTAVQYNIPDFLSKCLLLSISLYRSKIDLLKRIAEFAKTVTSCSSIENVDIALKECIANIESMTTIPAKTIKVRKAKAVMPEVVMPEDSINKRNRALDAAKIMAAKMAAEVVLPEDIAEVSSNKRDRALDAAQIITAKKMAADAVILEDIAEVSSNKRNRALDAAQIITAKKMAADAIMPEDIAEVSSNKRNRALDAAKIMAAKKMADSGDNKNKRALKAIIPSMGTISTIGNKRARALNAVHSNIGQIKFNASGQELCHKGDEVNVVPLFIYLNEDNVYTNTV